MLLPILLLTAAAAAAASSIESEPLIAKGPEHPLNVSDGPLRLLTRSEQVVLASLRDHPDVIRVECEICTDIAIDTERWIAEEGELTTPALLALCKRLLLNNPVSWVLCDTFVKDRINDVIHRFKDKKNEGLDAKHICKDFLHFCDPK